MTIIINGNNTPTAGSVGYGNGTELAFTSAGTAGNVLVSNGTSAPSWTASPTITSLTTPLVIGGTGTTSTLTLRSTSGVGATGADIILQVGNNGATEAMRVLNSGNVGIGTTTVTQKLQVAGNVGANGIAFPAVQVPSANANTLDYYEEGVWTPVMRDTTGNLFTTSFVDGRYTRIGNQVTASLLIIYTSIGAADASQLRVSVPISAVNSNFARFSAAIGNMQGFDTVAGTKQITANLDQGSNTLTFWQTNDNAGSTALPANSMSATGALQATITYFV